MPLGEVIEGGQELIEDPDRDLRRFRRRALGESHHVGEKHGDLLEPIGDRILLAFEPLRNLRWKDVEEKPLRSVHRLVTLNAEVPEDQGHNRRDAAQVEGKERGLSEDRQGWDRSCENWIKHGGDGYHGYESCKPCPTFSRAEEDEGAEGREE